MSGYDFHPEARFDLDEIWEFIRVDNLAAADKVVAEILSVIRSLVSFPGQGHRRPDLTSRPLRFLVVREYVIAYAPRSEAFVGCSGDARPPQPPRDGCNLARQRIAGISSFTGPIRVMRLKLKQLELFSLPAYENA